MVNFSDVSSFLAQSPLARHALGMLSEVESDLLFSIACEKDRIFREKKQAIQSIDVVVIANNTNFGNIATHNSFGPLKVMSAQDFKATGSDTALLEMLKNCLVITTSNIFAEIGMARLGHLYQDLPKTIFAVHDYDNHHWINNNIQAAIFSDVYVPSHQSDNLISSRMNPNIVGGIPCGTNQWSMEFVRNNVGSITSCNRSSDPLGKYYFYEKFILRNKAISTLTQSYPSISLLNNDFHSLTPNQKWTEWCSHKLHWIIPVLNDLPIRFFDALITGGMPLIPSGLIPFVKALNIPENFYISYGPLDIIDSKEFVRKANELFDFHGTSGIKARHEHALKNFHVDIIIEKIIASIRDIYVTK